MSPDAEAPAPDTVINSAAVGLAPTVSAGAEAPAPAGLVSAVSAGAEAPAPDGGRR